MRTITFLGPFGRADMAIYIDEERRRYLLPWPHKIKELDELRACNIASVRPVGEFLKNALQSMPRLHSIRLRLTKGEIPNRIAANMRLGVPMYLLSAMFSAPQLRHFSVQGMLCHPYDELLPPHLFPPSIPLESLVYDLGHNGASPQVTGVELSVVSLLLERTSATLRILELPSQSSPLHQMHLWTWPMLTKLSLHGERPLYEDGPPLVVALGRMPRLRELSLRFAEPTNTTMISPPIWPSSIKGSYEWPELERVFLTHPNPNDELYAHLPPSLQSLSLRCWPRHYKFGPEMRRFTGELRASWSSIVPCSSEMLNMLRRVRAPRLTILDVEYFVDTHDELLLRHIPLFYPHLKVLRIHRYRQATRPDICTVNRVFTVLGQVNRMLIYVTSAGTNSRLPARGDRLAPPHDLLGLQLPASTQPGHPHRSACEGV